MKAADYYVSIANPPELRRNLLAASKETVYLLKNYQKILAIRARKLEAIELLKRDLKELTLLTDKLAEIMPNREFSDEMLLPPVSAPPPAPAPHSPAAPKRAPRHGAERASPSASAELARLEDTLSRIESKLRAIK